MRHFFPAAHSYGSHVQVGGFVYTVEVFGFFEDENLFTIKEVINDSTGEDILSQLSADQVHDLEMKGGWQYPEFKAQLYEARRTQAEEDRIDMMREARYDR
jgi:hypothetical protein